MDITATRDLDLDAVRELYDAVGWSAYTQHPQDFGPMIENAWLVLAAHEGERLVGLARVVGDGATVACIQDLLVHPEHQEQGIGSRMLDRITEQVQGIRQVYICTDTDERNAHVVRLYQRKGFRPVGDLGCVTLARFEF